MTKKEFIEEIATRSGLTERDAEKAYRAFTEIVIETLGKGGKIQLPGFGTFETFERTAREGRSPRTGEAISIPAARLPRFRAGKGFKGIVKAEGEE